MPVVDDELDEGLKAYADEHAAMESAIADSLELKWATIRLRAQHMIDGKTSDSETGETQLVHITVEGDSDDALDEH